MRRRSESYKTTVYSITIAAVKITWHCLAGSLEIWKFNAITYKTMADSHCQHKVGHIHYIYVECISYRWRAPFYAALLKVVHIINLQTLNANKFLLLLGAADDFPSVHLFGILPVATAFDRFLSLQVAFRAICVRALEQFGRVFLYGQYLTSLLHFRGQVWRTHTHTHDRTPTCTNSCKYRLVDVVTAAALCDSEIVPNENSISCETLRVVVGIGRGN